MELGKIDRERERVVEGLGMRLSILNRLFATGGGGRIWRSRRSTYGSEVGGRMLMSTDGSSPSPSPSAPWLMLPPGRGSGGDILFNFYSLAEEKQLSLGGGFAFEEADNIRFVGSSHGWLSLFNQRTNALFLANPVSGRRINLPPPTVTDNSSTVSRVLLSCSPDDDEDEDECRAVMSFVPKVDVYDYDHSDADADIPLTWPPAHTLSLCLPVMSLGPAESLAFCCPNGSPVDWTLISTDRVTSCGDFVYSRRKGRLFCLTTSSVPELDWCAGLGFDHTARPNLSDVEVWDLSHPRIERRHSLNELPRLDKDSTGVSERRYLAYSEQSDQLYLVRRHMMERVDHAGNFVKDIYFHHRRGWDNSYPYKTFGFDIHRIDNDGKLLMDEEVSLDNVAIFIGINHGLVMEAADKFRFNSNSIYFTDDTIHTPPNTHDIDQDSNWRMYVANPQSKWVDSSAVYGGHDIGIFDYKNKTISPCFYPIDAQSLKRIDPPPLWFTPQE